jgi:predicted peroxiredoxin
MHFAISTTWGPTDVTRADIPFVFAAAALNAGDTVFIMLMHDASTIALKGAHEKMLPFGPPARFAEVFANPNAEIMVCKPCAEVRGIKEDQLVNKAYFGGMSDFHVHASRPDSKVVNF